VGRRSDLTSNNISRKSSPEEAVDGPVDVGLEKGNLQRGSLACLHVAEIPNLSDGKLIRATEVRKLPAGEKRRFV
jgi:hypothetical protein